MIINILSIEGNLNGSQIMAAISAERVLIGYWKGDIMVAEEARKRKIMEFLAGSNIFTMKAAIAFPGRYRL